MSRTLTLWHPSRFIILTRRLLRAVFFAQLHPFNAVIDEIAFLRDLSTSDVSPILLLSLYSLSARFQASCHSAPRFAAGERYARAARRMLAEEDSQGLTPMDKPDLETAQAVCFLAAHEVSGMWSSCVFSDHRG